MKAKSTEQRTCSEANLPAYIRKRRDECECAITRAMAEHLVKLETKCPGYKIAGIALDDRGGSTHFRIRFEGNTCEQRR